MELNTGRAYVSLRVRTHLTRRKIDPKFHNLRRVKGDGASGGRWSDEGERASAAVKYNCGHTVTQSTRGGVLTGYCEDVSPPRVFLPEVESEETLLYINQSTL